ncbi:uncharacterized protein ANIA_11423 [Aspergillus nidulans FGSC A4]|uniref:Uncharacterized protein n=1 Tax=Emericella nidulans (strain FGSC A4 / ATCC 38163 / CBS 112.46 / NRRL 194 / M139) TaxID=227321 RepID=C8V5R5_EMENI|nr:hypothetical protein [Aspergillus nidulans FGSC A4]CBF74908.1 TPA: hypothetical protein ANIA_11423 [Aspergillus nidulans FGSC A4]
MPSPQRQPQHFTPTQTCSFCDICPIQGEWLAYHVWYRFALQGIRLDVLRPNSGQQKVPPGGNPRSKLVQGTYTGDVEDMNNLSWLTRAGLTATME